jgi:hypothetical protein
MCIEVFLFPLAENVGKPKDRGNMKDLSVDGMITLRWIAKKQDVMLCTGFI